MQEVLEAAADRERGEHAYVNRTGDLNLNTFADLVRDDEFEVEVDLVMAMPYASYVIEDGLSTIEEQAERAERELDATFVYDLRRVM